VSETFNTRIRTVSTVVGSSTKEAAMEQRVSLITLGVADVARARAFYERLGWSQDAGVDDETDHVSFFQAGGMIVALWDRAKLAEDSTVEDSGGWGGVTLAYNVGSPEEVDAVLAEAEAAGAAIGRQGAATVWGGYSGLFIDPDGHPWEVAHNPRWTVHEDGRTTLA
jgi:predicted lactoylglutathione lyase